ncbi:MAG: MBL fold metallo-hydrolase [Tannerella sp.]|jgi:glyoxylase-like metal-dependent hydrolase (beta-lactamase superfamily II)|nr:MBL fold metallo-hydrolase [Tannerella sp.]
MYKEDTVTAGTSVELINTGYFHADGGSMFGATPRQAWSRRYPCDEQNSCLLAMRAGLVITGCGRIILIDSGVGDKQLERLKNTSYRFFDLTDICKALKARGIAPEQVTDVVHTHLHFDHCGATTRYECGHVVPAFPEATCWVSRAQWENSLSPTPLEVDSYFTENIDAVGKSGRLHLIDSDCDLCETVRLKLYDGHTCGQIAPCVKTLERTVVFAGDVIPLAANVSPLWISAYDTHPLTSYHEKLRMLNEAAAGNQLIVHYHDAYTPCSTVRKINNFFKADSVTEVVSW